MDINFISFVAFIIVVILLLISQRKKVKREGIIFIRRTPRGRNTIDKVARKNIRFWRIFGNIGVIVVIGVMIFGSYLLTSNALSIMTSETDQGAGIILPGPVSTSTALPGVFVIPWWFFVIGIVLLMVPHEFAHGIMSRVDKIRIKSVGWLFFAVLPGAFVEPDDNQIKKSKKSTKLRIYGAGGFANILTGLLIFALMNFVIVPSFYSSLQPQGVLFETNENSSLSEMQGAIVSVNNVQVRSLKELQDALSSHSAGDEVKLEIIPSSSIQHYFVLESVPAIVKNNETVIHQAAFFEDEGRQVIGITVALSNGSEIAYSASSMLLVDFVRLMAMMFIFTIGIGIVNLLPIKPLDGGLILEEIIPKSKYSGYAVKVISAFFLAVLVFNIVGPFFF